MKTAMELALARIEMLYGMKPDDIHWEMFKNDCMEKEKEQIIQSYQLGAINNYNKAKWVNLTPEYFEICGKEYYIKHYNL